METVEQVEPGTLDEGFPFGRRLSFELLAAAWEKTATDSADPAIQALAEEVCRRYEATPDLHGPIDDRDVLERHADLVQLLLRIVLPLSPDNEGCFAAILPLRYESVFQTPAFAAIGLTTPESFYGTDPDEAKSLLEDAVMRAYQFILRACYDVQTPLDYSTVTSVRDPQTRLDRYYRINQDLRFMTAVRTGGPDTLEPADVQRLLNQPTNRALWEELLPPEHFELQGLVLLNAVDITDKEALARLRQSLIVQGSPVENTILPAVTRHLSTLLQDCRLRLGLVVREKLRGAPFFRLTENSVTTSLAMIHSGEALPALYRRAARGHEPVVVPDLEAEQGVFESTLFEDGWRSLMIVPLHDANQDIGLLEIASRNTVGSVSKVLPILTAVQEAVSSAFGRYAHAFEMQIETTIKEHYTSLHPAVEWRFREAALRLLLRNTPDRPFPGMMRSESIIFRDVYGLYGLSDIRDSSTRQLEAVRADLRKQINLAVQVLEAAIARRPMPALQELVYHLHVLEREIDDPEKNVQTTVQDVLQQEVESLFPEISLYGDAVRRAITVYRNAVDPATGFIYEQRRRFDGALTKLTSMLADHLDWAQVEAQRIVPHYFQRYKSDGVDHNLYAGSSMLQSGSFSSTHLRSLRLWQLKTMCTAGRLAVEMKRELDEPLDVAHLILVQSEPFTIRFRQDEKRFDVDGAYNARYEITKKRIDKAFLADGKERLTQAGTISVVYTHPSERDEYMRYHAFLASEGLLTPEVKDVVLEPLAGTGVLRALRLSIPSPEAMEPEQPADHEDSELAVPAR